MATATPVRCRIRRREDVETGEQWLKFDFNRLLTKRGSDWWVYKNQWDKVTRAGGEHNDQFFKRWDSVLIGALVTALMADGTGVHSISVEPYTLEVFQSEAVDDQVVIDIINRVAAELGLCEMTPGRDGDIEFEGGG